MSGENLFCFCIPLIPRDRAENWQRALENLQATLQSALNQVDQNFVVYIASNDEITLPEVSNPKIIVCKVPFAHSAHEPANFYNVANDDAGAKRWFLYQKAYDENVGYVMGLDADDLVSNKLVQFARQQQHARGYVIRNGLVLDAGSGKCLPCPSKEIVVNSFDAFCGSSIIFKLDAKLRSSENWPFAILSAGHTKIPTLVAQMGIPLLDIEFPGVVYVLNTGTNISVHKSNEPERLKFMNHVISNIETNGQFLDAATLREYGLGS